MNIVKKGENSEKMRTVERKFWKPHGFLVKLKVLPSGVVIMRKISKIKVIEG